jgi:hypothetical protein
MSNMRDESSRLHINTTWPSTGRARRTILGVAAAAAAAGTIMVLSAAGGSAVAGADPSSITLCHATASTTNPYIVITVAPNSINQKLFGKNGHTTHVGPIFDPNGGKNQPAWGDIIPPFDWNDPLQHYPGLNWDATGIAIFEAGCKIVTPPESSPPPSTPVETTPVETTPVETTPVETSAPPSLGTSGATSHTGTPAVHTSSNGPIPQGVEAGLHTPISNAGLKAWGTVLMVLGGAAGLFAGLWPTRRRAH